MRPGEPQWALARPDGPRFIQRAAMAPNGFQWLPIGLMGTVASIGEMGAMSQKTDRETDRQITPGELCNVFVQHGLFSIWSMCSIHNRADQQVCLCSRILPFPGTQLYVV